MGNGGHGGVKGGGLSTNSYDNGDSATFFGSGGGGGGKGKTSHGALRIGAGGSGYQGIIYIRIPLDQRIYN